jgi:GT2 family glycosyltransferase
MRKKIKISIVVPNWNGASLLLKNLPKVVVAAKNEKNNIVEIIVVDDGSSDKSIEILETNFSNDVRVIKHKVNRGFSNAVNTGVRGSFGTHVCLLNTDVVPERSFLVSAIPLLKREKVFGVTLNEGKYGPAVAKFDGYFMHNSGEITKRPEETMWISGGSGIFAKNIWKELKGMDNDLYSPFYWEDVDLGYRARKRGYQLLWDPKAKVEHKHESVINPNNFRKTYLGIIKERNELLFIWKNITSKNLIKKHREALFNRLKRHPGYVKVVVAALLKWPIVVKRRKREREESVVSDEAIFTQFEK